MACRDRGHGGTIATTTAGAAAGKVVGMAAGAVAGTALGEAAGGLIQNLGGGVADAVKAGVGAVAKTQVETFNRGVRARMIGRLPLPRNHDLVAGVRRAHLVAVEKVLRFHERAEKARPPHERGDGSDDPAFAANLWDWLRPRLHGTGPSTTRW